MPKRVAQCCGPEGWDDGSAALKLSRRSGSWPDGMPVGRGFGQPYLRPEFAEDVAAGRKTIEGRPREGWAAAVKPNDWVTFKISGTGGRKLCCRILEVQQFADFGAMLRHHGVAACLPRCPDLAAAVTVYHSFGNRHGLSYKDLEETKGVVAIEVTPLASLDCNPERVAGTDSKGEVAGGARA